MNKSSLSFGIAARGIMSACLLTVSTYAMMAHADAPVVMLQLGAFESKAEADGALSRLKTKHAGVLGDMPMLVREGKTHTGIQVFRVQAGPLAGRTQAQSVCAQITSAGDRDCFIVESALPQTAAPATQVAQSAPLAKPTMLATAPALKPSTVPAPATGTINPMANVDRPATVIADPDGASVKPAPAATKLATATTPVKPQVVDEPKAAAPAAKMLAVPASTTTATAPSGAKLLAVPTAPTMATPAPATNAPVTGLKPSEMVAAPTTAQPVPNAAQVDAVPAAPGRINSLYDRVASPEAREPITDTAKAIKKGGTDTVASTATRDPQTAKMLSDVGNVQPNPTTAPLRVTSGQGEGVSMAAPSASMDEALKQAAQNQPTTLASKTPKTVKEATRESSWYDSVNPFSDDEEEAPRATQKKAAAPAEVEDDGSFFDSINPFSDTPAEKAKKAVTRAPAAPVAATTAAVAAPQVSAPVASEPASAPSSNALAMPVPTPASQPNLPPPPVPDSDAARAALANQIGQQPVNTQAPVMQAPVAPATVTTTSVGVAPLPDAPVIPKGTSIADAAKIMDAHNVKVEEARRVPLTADAPIVASPPPPVVASSEPAGVAPADLPSQTQYNRTLWAHISYFDNAQKALAFWEKFRQANQDFPSVRVRVTSAYVAQQAGNSVVSLRVGPFGNQAFISELCENDLIDDEDLTCRSITDTGSAANSSQPRMVQPVGFTAGRYGSSGKGLESREGVWVQLGAFDSAQKAESNWLVMKNQHPAALRAMQAQVSTPPQGSNENSVYRLRTGPFVSQMAAEELCNRLKLGGASCLVVSEK